jgi:hypothetical protein
MENKFILDVSKLKEFLVEAIDSVRLAYTVDELCRIHSIFISESGRVPDHHNFDYDDYMLTFYTDVDSDFYHDKIHLRLTVSSKIPRNTVVATYIEVISEITDFTPMISIDEINNIDCDKLSLGIGSVNVNLIGRIFRAKKIVKSSPRNKILFSSGATLLIHDCELNSLLDSLEKLNRYDLLLEI